MPGPLQGIKVLDLSAVISGPMACQVLADQGAEVIKIEPPVTGDITRLAAFRVGSISSIFAAVNRGKQSLVLDLRAEAGVEALLELTRDADVLVQNFRPGAVERMGIGPDAVHAINPALIYVSISGFGTSGPYRDWRVYDPIIQSLSGLVSIQQSREVPIPDLVRTILCDKATALTAAQAISAALFARATGKAAGQVLDIPMLDATLYWLWPDILMGHTFTGKDVVPGATLYEIYRLQPTSDGHIVYFTGSDKEFTGLVAALGHPEWAEDERFANVLLRSQPETFELLGEMLHNAFLDFSTEEILARLEAHEVPAAPVLSLEEMFDDPQVVHNEIIHEWVHPTVGPARMAKPPVRFSSTQHEPAWSVDSLGESSEAVLRDAGFDEERIARLREQGIIPGSEQARLE
jgi:crotonobetainyl-CoA:carnitine CoA-transferase CaiB-like acyl-CoA transferase